MSGFGDASAGSSGPTSNGKSDKRMSVERIYQKKTQLEHILLRPDTYIGSTQRATEKMWVVDNESDRIISREISYVPGLYKIFDEVNLPVLASSTPESRFAT
jgi:DNA topoisomerase-2